VVKRQLSSQMMVRRVGIAVHCESRHQLDNQPTSSSTLRNRSGLNWEQLRGKIEETPVTLCKHFLGPHGLPGAAEVKPTAAILL
jgi:hypothetical protein